LEYVVHKGLGCSRNIRKSHWHDQELEGAISCSEGCLPLLASCDANIVVASVEVKLSVDLCTTELVEEVCNKGDQVPILLNDFVEVPEVDTESQGTVLLLGKENRCACW